MHAVQVHPCQVASALYRAVGFRYCTRGVCYRRCPCVTVSMHLMHVQ
nr:MAG TPA: VanW like protein [Caudoviricetes sp.]